MWQLTGYQVWRRGGAIDGVREYQNALVEHAEMVVHDRVHWRVILVAIRIDGVTDLVVYDSVQQISEHAARRRAGYVR